MTYPTLRRTRAAAHVTFLALASLALVAFPRPEQAAQDLTVHIVGNAGVVLTDGATALLIDLPYEPGAFGYMRYDPAALEPPGAVVSVITHDHRDHFDPGLFLQRTSWRIMGPPSVTDGLPPDRVLEGDSLDIGAFSVTAIPTPHTSDHRSYRVRWRGRVLHFMGDTDRASAVPTAHADVLFVTPWLQCALVAADRSASWDLAVLYHARADGSDPVCGPADPIAQGGRFTLTPRKHADPSNTASAELMLSNVRGRCTIQNYENTIMPDSRAASLAVRDTRRPTPPAIRPRAKCTRPTLIQRSLGTRG
jgi:glyoxylase-like metal-dependent hydrolase (beta-lactamase superfamily II)